MSDVYVTIWKEDININVSLLRAANIVFPNTIANVLTDHNKAAHDALMVGYQNIPSNADLVAYYSLDEDTGDTVHDNSSEGGEGTLQNMEEEDWVPGKVNSCLSFDGVDEFVDCDSTDSLAKFSISVWVKPDGNQAANAAIISDKYVTNKVNYTIYFAANNLDVRCSIYSSGWKETADFTLTDGVWTHIVFTYDGKTLRMYINGVEEQTHAWVGAPASDNSALFIGQRWDGGVYFKGLIDEVRIYNVTISAQSAKELYLASRGV